ncbi:MAG: hypothetical protein JWM33_1738 [Caulobacteraceae bacterium]|nr:hypothetical protein [Caulobacteraceae bacterium]
MRLFVLLIALLAAVPTWGLAAPARIPFKVVNDLMVVTLQVQGQPTAAIVDTGSQGTVIDSTYAQQHGLRGGAPGRGGGRAGGRGPPPTINDQPASVARNISFQLGDQTFALSPGVTDLGPSAVKQLGTSVVLGRELFETFVVEMDFDAKVLVLHPRADFIPPAGANLVQLTRKGGPRGAVLAPVRVEKGAMLQALVDTGDPRAIGLNQTAAAARGLDTRPGGAYRGYGVNVTTDDKVVTVASVEFAGVALTAVPLAITADSTPVFGDDPARIGLPLLSRFHVWMDFGGARMWLSPSVHARDPFRKDTLGFSGQFDQGGVKIDRVSPTGPAAAAGLKAGDMIVGINDQQPQAFLSLRPWNLLVPLNIRLADGRSVLLRPAEFY